MPHIETTPELFPASAEGVSVKWLENLLQGAGCWMTAKDIQLSTHGKVDDRTIRRLASKTTKIISGDKGYQHIEHSTLEQSDHAANRLISQGKEMIKRGIGIRREAHRRIG